MTEEEKYKEELKANGVDIPEEETEKPEEEPKEEKKPEKAEEKPEEKPTEPAEPKKRSIYDEYKDKKSELKDEKEARLQAERERDEFRTKYETLAKAETPEEKKEAIDDLDSFAKANQLDPTAIKQMRDLFLKDVQKPEIDESIKKGLVEFQSWKSQNQQAIDKQQFEDEFQKATPTLKELFPKISEDEMKEVKKELNSLAHSKEWHNQELDVIAFKHREKLSSLVSPKKRGLESKGSKDITPSNFDFDPNADYSKMSIKERELWEEGYKKLMKSEGLVTDNKGKKLLI